MSGLTLALGGNINANEMLYGNKYHSQFALTLQLSPGNLYGSGWRALKFPVALLHGCLCLRDCLLCSSHPLQCNVSGEHLMDQLHSVI